MHFCTKCDNMYYIRIGAAAGAVAAGGDDGVVGGGGQFQEKQDATSLFHYCRNCGHEVKIEKTICVSKLQLKHNAQSYSNVINKYTKLDPTLPRINNIKCPNSQCRSNPSIGEAAAAAAAAAIKMKPRATGGLDAGEEEEAYEDLDVGMSGVAANFKFPAAGELAPREVIYIRYDEVNMKYVYMCAVCDTVWNTSQSNIL
jgi:hypothetical protein